MVIRLEETVVSYHHGENRTAQVIWVPNKGWQTRLYEDGMITKTVEAYDKSEDYADSIAENWVLEIL